MTTQDCIEDIVDKLRHGGPRLVYMTARDISSCEIGSDKADRIIEEHQSLVIGVYDRRVKPADLREDIHHKLNGGMINRRTM